MADKPRTMTTEFGNVITDNQSAAEKAALLVNDVKGVAEEIEVQLPFNVKHGDEEIASAAVSRLKWDSTVPSGAVKAKVEKGWVTLTGEVERHYQQEAAVAIFAGFGVIGVSNEIKIKPKPNTSAIRDSIMVALDRSCDRAAINVTAQGGKSEADRDSEFLVRAGRGGFHRLGRAEARPPSRTTSSSAERTVPDRTGWRASERQERLGVLGCSLVEADVAGMTSMAVQAAQLRVISASCQ